LAALRREIAGLGRTDRAARTDVLDTLFIGGGTPTQLGPSGIDELKGILADRFAWDETAEVTAEANPTDLNGPVIEALLRAGVNRVSIGVQSFDDRKLAALDRRHSADDARAAIAAAQQAFPHMSVDLIFGAPGETLDDWSRDLDALIECEPSHVSTYELTIEKGTAFWNQRRLGRLAVPDEDQLYEMYVMAIERLSAAGYNQYEVSSFARPGHRCRHNETYWLGRPYWAIGPGAASYVDGRRTVNHASLHAYARRLAAGQSPAAEIQLMTIREAAVDRLVFGLRRIDGVVTSDMIAATGWSPRQLVGDTIDQLVDLELLQEDNHTIRLTRRGLLVADWVAGRLVADAAAPGNGHNASAAEP
jgi:oxygen-independent coproporphyrinogen-3 oxidase